MMLEWQFRHFASGYWHRPPSFLKSCRTFLYLHQALPSYINLRSWSFLHKHYQPRACFVGFWERVLHGTPRSQAHSSAEWPEDIQMKN